MEKVITTEGLLRKWFDALQKEPYFRHHFLATKLELGQSLLATLRDGAEQANPVFEQIVEFTGQSPIRNEQILDSLFRLRDLLAGDPELQELFPEQGAAVVRQLEVAILHLHRLLSREVHFFNRHIIDQIFSFSLGSGEFPITLNDAFEIYEINPKLARKFEYTSPGALTGVHFSRLFSPSSHSILRYAQDQLTSGQRLTMRLDLEAVTRSGRKFQADLRLRRIVSDQAGIISVSLKDLSYQSETQHILSLMHMALENIGEGIVITEPQENGRILFINEALEQRSGYFREDLFGKVFRLLCAETTSSEKIKNIFSQAARGGWEGEIEGCNKDGGHYPVYLHIQPVRDEYQKVVALVAVWQDLSRQKRQEEDISNLQTLIQQIINNLPPYLLVTETDLTIRFWNKSLERISPFSADKAVGKSLWDICPELAEVHRKMVEDALPRPGRGGGRKILLKLFSEQPRYYQLSLANLIPGDSGSPLMWVLIDVHEQELHKQQITLQNRRLAFLQNLANTFIHTLNLQKTLPVFAREFSSLFNRPFMEILLPVDNDQQFYKSFFRFEQDQAEFPEEELFFFDTRDMHQRLQSEELYTQFTRDDLQERAYLGRFSARGWAELAGFPIVFSGETIAILLLGFPQPGMLQPEDLDFLHQILGHLTLAIKNYLHFDQLEKQTTKLFFLQKLSAHARTAQTEKELLRSALPEFIDTFHYQAAAVYAVYPGGRWKHVESLSITPGLWEFPEEIHLPGTGQIEGLHWKADQVEKFWRQLNDGNGANIPGTLLCLREPSVSQQELIIICLTAHHLPDISFDHHLQLMREIGKELTLALDHVALFKQTVQAEKEWQSTFDQVEMGLAVIDKNLAIKRVNRRFAEMLGLDPHRIVAQNCWEVLKPALEIEPLSVYDLIDFGQQKRSLRWEKTRQGASLIVKLLPFLDTQDQFSEGIFTIQDVTREREREAHIRYLSRFPEINPSIVISLNPRGEIIYMNPAAQALLDTLRAQNAEAPSLLPVTLLFELETGMFRRAEIHEYMQDFGEKVIQYYAFMPEEDDNIYLYGNDITDRLHLQEKLIQTERMRAMGEMAAGVAHDFNNLLTTILGKTQLLQLRLNDPLVKAELEVVEKAAKDGAQIVKRMQETTRKKREKQFQNLYLDEIIRDSIQYSSQKLKLNTQVKGHKTRLQTHLEEKIVTYGNPIELKEVFTNLINNAVDAMPKGGELTITAQGLEEDLLEVRIKDTGVGMAAKVRQKIFDPFFTTKGERGTGLGLSLVYNIVTAHRGTIAVESEPGQGTEFIIQLPRSSETPAEKSQQPPTISSILAETTLLVVDDELELLETIAEVLKLKFKTVEMAQSGEEALQKIARQPFDIVLTDLGMPEMSGWEVAREVKKMLPKAKVILVTGWGMQAEEEHKNHQYVDQILSKPYDLHNLLHVIEQVQSQA